MNTARTQKITGVALIEILMSLLILSVGVIGLSNVQINAKRLAQEALQRTKAASLASDMLERIRANPKGFATYNGAEVGRSSASTEPADCRFVACAPAGVAARDLWEWEQTLDGADETRMVSDQTRQVGGLYLPYGCVITDFGGQASRVQVTISWEGFRDLGYTGANTCGAILGLKRQLLSFESFVAGTR